MRPLCEIYFNFTHSTQNHTFIKLFSCFHVSSINEVITFNSVHTKWLPELGNNLYITTMKPVK